MQEGAKETRPRWTPDTPLQYLPGVGPQRAQILERLGLKSVRDLLWHFPRRYEDRRRTLPVAAAAPGETVVLHGRIGFVRGRPLPGGRYLLQAELEDPSGRIELVWFNQPWLEEFVLPGRTVWVYGPVRRRRERLQVVSPEFELDGEDDGGGEASLHLNRIVPVYPLTRGLQQRFLRRLVHRALESAVEEPEGPYLHFHPAGPTLEEALRAVHFPPSFEELERAKARFKFEEHFRFASRLVFLRERFRSEDGISFRTTAELDAKIRSIFPFRFTPDQDRAVSEIARDLEGPRPMYRLLQGDVGTGKTAVAIYALLVAVRNAHQGAVLAPTELLAEQHFRTVTRLLARYPVRVELLTGSISSGQRRAVLEGLASGRSHLVVGTHALVQDDVRFRRLGLVVIDEQHRFGVRERLKMRKKGRNPHLLVMTATPIPRSLCLTCYGDLDLTLLREKPPGRTPVTTRLVTPKQHVRALEFVRRELRKGRQAYFVYPLIEESENLDLPAAVEAHKRLSEAVYPEFSVGLVHGRLPPQEKEERFERFRRGEYRVLVATVVVEVGVDVPNATVMFIEDASRFGLAQLHQLRGRVGRGEHPGYCLVGVGEAGAEARKRLRVFASTEDGFRLAEEDLRLRGPGDYLGVRQSGRPSPGLGNPLEDLPGFLRVRRLAREFWSRPENAPFRDRWRAFLEAGGGLLDGEFAGLD